MGVKKISEGHSSQEKKKQPGVFRTQFVDLNI